MGRALTLVAAATVAALLPAAATADPSGPPVSYRAPVPGPVLDPFRPPSTPYGPGNRGLEYATTPGEPVGAPADGEVTFAGPVAGGLHVVLLHADGIRTSLSFLAAVLVRRGQRVAAGDPVGLAGSSLHFGARRGEAYLDPATLLAGAGRPGRAFLVPVGTSRPLDAATEAAGLRRLLAGDRGSSVPAGRHRPGGSPASAGSATAKQLALGAATVGVPVAAVALASTARSGSRRRGRGRGGHGRRGAGRLGPG